MFDLIPWLDETYIVEMGRLFLERGGASCSTLSGLSDVVLRPLCYVGPLLQELLFRCFGILGVRLSPYVGLGLAYVCFRCRIRRDGFVDRSLQELLPLLLLTSPMLFQSALLSRIDCWALACVFASLAVLGMPDERRGMFVLFAGAWLAVLSFFIWPTSAVLFVVYPVFAFSKDCLREFLWFCLFAVLSFLLFLIPVAGDIHLFLDSFLRHYGEVTSPATTFLGIILPMMREVARSPFVAILSVAGMIVWVKRRRVFAIAAFAVVFVVCARAGLYTFRIVYLIPFFLFMCVDAAVAIHSRCPRFARAYLIVAVAYGALTGPIGHFALSYPTLPEGLQEILSAEVGTGPINVFSPDHATYYIGRELGWHQIGFARPSDLNDTNVLARVLSDCDAAVLRDFDPYTPFQQSCTPYGFFCRYVLSKAREERDVPLEQKSWAARFGGQFSFSWHAPLSLDDFRETKKVGMIRIFRRIRPSR